MPSNYTGKEGSEQEGFEQEGAGDVAVPPVAAPIPPPSYTFQVGSAEVSAEQVGSGPSIPPVSGGVVHGVSPNMEGNMELLLGGING